MAITVVFQPQPATPAYNEQLLVLTSTNSGQTGFEYIVTIQQVLSDYSGLGNAINLRKSPDPNGYGVFDLSKITADFVDSDFDGNVDQFVQNENTQKAFYYTIASTWDGGSEIGTSGLFTAFNGVINVEDWITFSYENAAFQLNSPYDADPAAQGQGFLTNYRDLQKSKLTECGFLYFQSNGISIITGAEKITNGGFNFNLNSWTLDSAGDFTWDSELAKSNTSSVTAQEYGIKQTLSLTNGKYYELSFDANLGKGTLSVNYGAAGDPEYIILSTSTGKNYGQVKTIFKASALTTAVGFFFSPSVNGEFMTLDNVSLREVEILPFSAEIKTYDTSNTLINTFVLKNDNTYTKDGVTYEFGYDWVQYSQNDQSRLNSWRIPAGAKNLNLIDNSLLTTGSQPIITSSVKYWEIKVKTSDGNLYGSYKGYLNDACSKYKSFRLHWLNRLGGMDSFTFDMASQEDINIQREFYNRLMSRDYAYNSTKSYGYTTREETQYHTQYKTAYSVASNWISESESNMLAELMTSPNVYWEKDSDNNKFIPINIKANTYRKQSKTANNTKVFNLEFQFEVSYNEKIQGR